MVLRSLDARWQELHPSTPQLSPGNLIMQPEDDFLRGMSPNSYGKLLREIAGPRLANDPIKAVIARVAKQVGLSYWRTYDIWYGKNHRLERHEEEQILEARRKQKRLAAKNELAELRTRMARLESLLLCIDEEFHRENVGALRAAARGNR